MVGITNDAARRAQLQQPTTTPTTTKQTPADPTLSGVDQAAATRDLVAAADVDNERVRAVVAADASRTVQSTPALPTTAVAAGASEQGPYRVPGNDRAVVSDAEQARLDDPATRFGTALDIGERVAKREAMEQAFTTPQQLAQAEQLFAQLPAAERQALAGVDTTELQDAVLGTPQGIQRNELVADIRARAGIVGDAPPIDDGTIGGRAGEVLTDLTEQSMRERLTDAQLAAGWNRADGMLRAAGGGAEVVGGAVALTAPTGATQFGGALLVAHGVDGIQAGVRQVIDGQPVQSLTEQAIAATARHLGADEQTANTIATVGDTLLPVALTPSSLLKASTAKRASDAVGDVVEAADTVPWRRLQIEQLEKAEGRGVFDNVNSKGDLMSLEGQTARLFTHKENWARTNIDDTVGRLIGDAPDIVAGTGRNNGVGTSIGKVDYSSASSDFKVVQDARLGYFRVEANSDVAGVSRSRPYVMADGRHPDSLSRSERDLLAIKTDPNNGRVAEDDYLRLTHFTTTYSF